MVESPVLFEYLPNYAVPPGATLAEVLDERGMSQAELAQRTDLSAKHINRIVNGHVRISTDVAIPPRAGDGCARPALAEPGSQLPGTPRQPRRIRSGGRPALARGVPIAAMVRLGILTKRLGNMIGSERS